MIRNIRKGLILEKVYKMSPFILVEVMRLTIENR